jgi:uncharacterized protein (TIGR02145 family)
MLSSFCLYAQDSLTDIGGNVYKTVTIGRQVWMAENLNVDHYRNGDSIPEVKDSVEWKNLTSGAWCYYNSDPEMTKKYGKLYNWYAVNDLRGLAPKGWHIPTLDDFRISATAVNNDGNTLKTIGQGTGDGEGTNSSGFSALLAGYRNYSRNFRNLGFIAYFRSSTEENNDNVCIMNLFYNNSNIYWDLTNDKKNRFSIRCLKN